MLSNIEQAVIGLLDSKQTINVSNVFSAYLRISGLEFHGIDEAVIPFERALDKHAVRPDVVQSPMIVKLRKQYWYTKLGGCTRDGECQTCEHCGGMKLQEGTKHAHGRGERRVDPVEVTRAHRKPLARGEF